jgi:hypothetical protein
MERLDKFRRLPAEQRWLLIRATVLLASIRASLALLPYPWLRPYLDRASRRSRRLAGNPQPADSVAWATQAAGRIVPGGGHCLSQALTLRMLLARRGYASTICFGVQAAKDAPFMAHAWVEHEGRILIGGENLDRFRRLVAPQSPQ